MAWKSVKDSLPWLVPSVAIVIGASGMLDRNMFGLGGTDEAEAPVAQAPAPIAPAQTALVAPVPTQPASVAPAPVQVATPAPVVSSPEVVTRQDTTTLLSLSDARPAPEVDNSARDRQRALAAASAATTTFNASAAADAARAQCVDDLKATVRDVRVYFPSGGVSADATGIEQGRLIGLIAQGCPDVRIRVEGHSDASGNPTANQRLSRARAEEVIKRLGAGGMDTSMFFAEGMGSSRPSGIVGPEPRTYYDRRVEFSVVDNTVQVVSRAPLAAQPWVDASSCYAELQRATQNTILFYTPGSVSLQPQDYDTAMALAEKAMQCPGARLRIVGRYSDAPGANETTYTARLRAKAVMAILVARGAEAEQLIMSAPSWAAESATQTGLPGHRINFDVIREEG